MKTVPIYLLILMIAACSPEPETQGSFNKSESANPLDSILGDKIVDRKTKKLRPNNFQKLLSITRLDLEQESSLYNLKKLDDNLKILTQKRTYSEARNFSAILKIEKEKISKYLVLNDSQIEGAYQDSLMLYILTGDMENHNLYWKPENKIRLLKFDDQLNQLWEYSAKSKRFPLRAIGLRNENDQLIATIEVITGCHICTSTFELTLNDKGNCISAIETDKTNSTFDLDSMFISATFIK